jgi:hypothetical protein
MATGFTLHKIDYANTPSGNQTWQFQYKLWSDPESAYVDIGTELVDVNGNILASPPLEVTGLTEGQLYYVKAMNLCDSPVDFFVISIQL